MNQLLYLKTHNKTGKKYLGQTTRNPYTYKGSGVLWNKHLNKHGNDVTTQVLFESDNKELFQKTAKEYSKKFNVVNNSEFLNLVDEHGGNLGGTANPNYKNGMLVGAHDNPKIRKRADKIRNAERYEQYGQGQRYRMTARYYYKKGNIVKAKEFFDAWQEYKKQMPHSSKGNYVRKFETWEQWTAKQT